MKLHVRKFRKWVSITKHDIEEIGFGFYGRHVETWEMVGSSFLNLDDLLWSVPELHKENTQKRAICKALI